MIRSREAPGGRATRKSLSAGVVGLAVAGALWFAGSAGAASFTSYAAGTFSSYFIAAGCGDTDTVVYTYPSYSYNDDYSYPLQGDKLRSSTSGATVATITSVDYDGTSYVWTATGSDDVCANPSNYAEGWRTQDLDFFVSYSWDYQPCGNARLKRWPGIVPVEASGYLSCSRAISVTKSWWSRSKFPHTVRTKGFTCTKVFRSLSATVTCRQGSRKRIKFTWGD